MSRLNVSGLNTAKRSFITMGHSISKNCERYIIIVSQIYPQQIITLRETKLWTNVMTVNNPLKLDTRAGDSNDCITVMAITRMSKMTMKRRV
jgi:hypothetical protein